MSATPVPSVEVTSGAQVGTSPPRVSTIRIAMTPIALAVLMRLFIVVVAPTPPRWDGVFYARLAAHLAAGDGYVAEAPSLARTAFYPPGYPAAIAIWTPITGSVRRAAMAVNLVAAALAVCAIVHIGRHLGGDRVALAGGFAYALYPGAILWSGAVMTETLQGALLVAACAVAMMSTQRPCCATIVAGVLTGLATLVRPQSILVAPLLGLAAAGLPARWRVARALLITVVALAVVAPWTLRNCGAVGGCALVSTNGGSNLLIGTFPEVLGGYRRPVATDGCGTLRTEFLRDACMRRVAVDRIRARPLAWLMGTVAKLARTFAWEHDVVTYHRRDHPTVSRPVPFVTTVVTCSLAWWMLMVCAARGARRAGAEGWMALTVCMAIAASHAVFLGADRYHLALVPLLCPLAALGIAARTTASG